MIASTDNAFIESFNGKFRAECLNVHWLMSLDDAPRKCELPAGEGGCALFDEMRHALLEVLGLERVDHFRVGHGPGFGQRLEVGLED